MAPRRILIDTGPGILLVLALTFAPDHFPERKEQMCAAIPA